MRTLVCWRELTNSTNRASLLKLDRKMVKGLVGHSPPGRTGEPPPRWFWKIAAAPLSLTAQFEAGSSNPAAAILPNQGPGVAPGAGTGDRHGLQSSPRAGDSCRASLLCPQHPHPCKCNPPTHHSIQQTQKFILSPPTLLWGPHCVSEACRLPTQSLACLHRLFCSNDFSRTRSPLQTF